MILSTPVRSLVTSWLELTGAIGERPADDDLGRDDQIWRVRAARHDLLNLSIVEDVPPGRCHS